MLTILHPDDWERWLSGPYDDVLTSQRPYPAEEMRVRGRGCRLVGGIRR